MVSPSAEPRTGTPALSLDRVTHAYGRMTAVDDVSLAIRPGEILSLVGPSGCGKSTLLRIAAGVEEVQSGTVRIAGSVVAEPRRSLPPEQRGVGLVFQDYALFPHLSVIDNVRFGIRGEPAEAARRRALETLEAVGMADFAAAYPHTLSGGQQQRVALARALAPEPRVLLLDEPFSGLDSRLRGQVRDETLHLLKRNGVATMIVTHDPEEAMFLADRIVLMRGGQVVQAGAPADLYLRPVDLFAATFFGEVNHLTGTVRHGRVETPIGAIAADRHPDGTAVDILIRPEALRLDAAAGDRPGVGAQVEAARLLGRTSLVHLSVGPAADGAAPVHLHARIPGQFHAPEGSRVVVSLDPRQTFVFPR